MSSIPGPRGLPLLGNILQIDSEKPHHSVTELAGSYGEVFKINMLGLPIVVVSGRTQLHEMLVKKGSDFAGRIDNVVIKHTSMGKFDTVNQLLMFASIEFFKFFTSAYLCPFSFANF